MKFPILSLLVASALLTSCSFSPPHPDVSHIKSVGVANGLDDTLIRNHVGTTVFTNSHEETKLPGLSSKITNAAVRKLKGRFSLVAPLQVAAKPNKALLFFGNNYSTIDHKVFQADSLAAAKSKNLDAVWIIYPASYQVYGARGGPVTAVEHRHESFLGITRESVSCAAYGELYDARSGTLISKSSFVIPCSVKALSSRHWEKKLSAYDSAARSEITQGAVEISTAHMELLIDGAGLSAR